MTTLEMIVNHNIRDRHRLVCSKMIARKSIAALRAHRAAQQATPKLPKE